MLSPISGSLLALPERVIDIFSFISKSGPALAIGALLLDEKEVLLIGASLTRTFVESVAVKPLLSLTVNSNVKVVSEDTLGTVNVQIFVSASPRVISGWGFC